MKKHSDIDSNSFALARQCSADRWSASNSTNPIFAGQRPALRHYRTEDGWRSRGYLPHYDSPYVFQFVTFRLADSLPTNLISRLKQINSLPSSCRSSQNYKTIEGMMDKGYGSCFLKLHKIASIVRDSIFHRNGKHYQLAAYCIMPNHVHLLIKLYENIKLSCTLKELKSYTASKANQILGRSGPFWAREYFDRYIRDKDHFETVRFYILNNPVKAHLVTHHSEWPYSWAESLDKSYE